MKYSLLFYILLFVPLISNAQVVLTTSQILSSAKNQPNVQYQERKLDFLKNSTHELPLINRLEIRTQTHDWDLSEQLFTFRARPNSRKERISQRQLHSSTIQWYEEETRQILLEGIQKRYNTCLMLFFSKKRLELMSNLEKVYKELARNYESSNDLGKMLEVEEAEQDFSVQFFDYQNEVKKAIRQTHYYLEDKGTFVLDDQGFLSIEVLKERLVIMHTDEPLSTPSLSLLNSRINQIDKELNLVLAQQKKWFSFAQLKYGKEPNTFFKETFSATLAFQLPVKGNSILKINELELDKIKAKNDFGIKNYLIQKKSKLLSRDLTNWLEKQDQLSKRLKTCQEKFTKSYKEYNFEDRAIIALKIKAHLLKKELALTKIEENIYHTYVDWLAITGKMIELPLVNYLSVNLDQLD